MRLTEEQKNRVFRDPDIRAFIPGADETKAKSFVTCPFCGASGKKGMCVTYQPPTKNFAYCFSCNQHLSSAVEAVMKYEDKSKREAIEVCAAHLGIAEISDKSTLTEIPRCRIGSFAFRQLKASGLNAKELMARVYDADHNPVKDIDPQPVFVSGGISAGFRQNLRDNDMLIYYYDINGNRATYASKGVAGNPKPYFRIRFENPDENLISGKAAKYMSPKGSEVMIYIPEYVRSMYHAGEKIETLVIQEGEKKAEKACRHGIPSLAIQGIFNIGNKEQGLPKEIRMIVDRCNVKNIVLLFDSDWNNLSSSLKNGDAVEQRPKMFARAAVKFRQYIRSLYNFGLSVDTYIAHINENEAGDKGIDDLLVNSLAGKEEEFLKDMRVAMNSHDGKGSWVDVVNVSTVSESRIFDLWLLNDKERFFEAHRQEIQSLKFFSFNRVNYVQDENGISLDNFSGNGAKFWLYSVNEKGKEEISFDYVGCFAFLVANGFRKVVENKDGQHYFIKIDKNSIEQVPTMYIREFVFDFVKSETKLDSVKRYFYANINSLLSDDKLTLLDRMNIDEMMQTHRDRQRFTFVNRNIYVSAEGVTDAPEDEKVWRSSIIDREFSRVPIIENIELKGNRWELSVSPAAMKCEFYRFLRNTCDFWKDTQWRQEQQDDLIHHLVNKITAIGYLVTDGKDRKTAKAVVAMDGRMSEVGTNSGRSGKSLIGKMLMQVKNGTVVQARTIKNIAYMYSDVRMDTKIVFIEDIDKSFNLDSLRCDITDSFEINVRYGKKFTIDFNKSPKLYITSNHGVNTDNGSTLSRLSFMLFSSYYNADFTPLDDFRHELFTDWDDEQWNLFYNLLIDCVMWFMKFKQSRPQGCCGIVEPPMERIKDRGLRQDIGEIFIDWADAYFSDLNGKLNVRMRRKEVYNDFCEWLRDRAAKISTRLFSDKLKKYCRFKNFDFNMSRPTKEGVTFRDHLDKGNEESFIGGRDVSGPREYFTISTRDFSKSQKWI